MQTSALAANRSATVACIVMLALLVATVRAGEGNSQDGKGNGDDQGCLPFVGAWFEVCGPSGFTVVPSLRSATAEGYDSVRFVSPDGKVSFYVFAPQWGGEAADIAVDPEREVVVAEETYPATAGEIRFYTIAAVDGSYRRSYRDRSEQQGSVRTVFGIKYQDADALERYRAAYDEFRASLRQYGD